MSVKFHGPIQFIDQMRAAISVFFATGLKMESECLSLNILQKLPREYDSLVWVISQMDPIPDEQEVLRRIEKDQLQFNVNRDRKMEALFTKKPFNNKFNKFN